MLQGSNFLAAFFVYMFVPEMSGLSLEEINLLFQSRVPARKSIAWNKEVRARDHGYGDGKDVASIAVTDPNAEVHNGEKAKPVAQHLDSRESTSTAV